MKIAIVIPTYKRPFMVERLLTNLTECAFPSNVSIYVIENGPRSGTEEVCNAISVGDRVLYLYSPKAKKTFALNLAIRSSDAEFFIFFDDDIKVPSNIITDYVRAAQRYGTGHFFGGPLIADAEVPCPIHLMPYLPPSAKGRSFGDQEMEIEPSRFDYFFGANWGAFRMDLMALGLFTEPLGVSDTPYSPLGEESDLQQRLIRESMKAIYIPSAVIYHSVPKECYTPKWVCHRHFRHGLTESIINLQDLQRSDDILARLLSTVLALCKQQLKVLVSAVLCFPKERRTAIKIYEAYLRGKLYGIWTRGRPFRWV